MRSARLEGRYLPGDTNFGPGLVQALSEGVADAGANPLLMRPERFHMVAFTLPFAYYFYGYQLMEEGLGKGLEDFRHAG